MGIATVLVNDGFVAQLEIEIFFQTRLLKQNHCLLMNGDRLTVHIG